MLSIKDIKLNCRIDGDEEDLLLQSYLDAAKEALRQQTNRNWYEYEVPKEDTTGMLYNGATDQALLLLTSNWYANRESVNDKNLSETPQGFWWLIQPYRIYGI